MGDAQKGKPGVRIAEGRQGVTGLGAAAFARERGPRRRAIRPRAQAARSPHDAASGCDGAAARLVERQPRLFLHTRLRGGGATIHHDEPVAAPAALATTEAVALPTSMDPLQQRTSSDTEPRVPSAPVACRCRTPRPSNLSDQLPAGWTLLCRAPPAAAKTVIRPSASRK